MSLASLLAEQGHTPAATPAPRKNAGNTGKAFEKELERTCGAYNSMRVARLQKVDPPVRIIWPFNPKTGKNEQRIIFQVNPWNDFAGCWTANGGRMLIIEAKSTSERRLAFNRDTGGFTKVQWTAMKSWHWGGAVTALLWQFNGKLHLFTPAMLLQEEGKAVKSITHETGISVPAGIGSVIWDFLTILEKHTET